ncbi:MAG TPA: DUF58 domain-containing protein [Candidatus Dormibacteraeota bacterium]|nr:DUF58 domain-containing protein [Candidatus Dormibacteraeota bacterium]
MGIVLALVIALLLVMAYLTAVKAAFVLGYGLALLFLISGLWPRLAGSGMKLVRVLDPGDPITGGTFRETFELSKAGVLPAPWVEVRDQGRVPGYRPGRVLNLGRNPVAWTVPGIYRRRGWAVFGPTMVIVSEPFGIFQREEVFLATRRVLVRPRPLPIPDLHPAGTQPTGESPQTGAWADLPPDSSSIRDYQPGDAFGRIHWPLSVRSGHLVSKTFEQPLAGDLWILLDLDRSTHLGGGSSSTVEYAVSLAASAVEQASAQGRSVGLLATDAVGTVISPVRADRVATVLDYLALVEADGSRPLASLSANELRPLARQSTVVITASSDSRWVSVISDLAARGYPPVVLWLDATAFASSVKGPATASSPPRTPGLVVYQIRPGPTGPDLTSPGAGNW